MTFKDCQDIPFTPHLIAINFSASPSFLLFTSLGFDTQEESQSKQTHKHLIPTSAHPTRASIPSRPFNSLPPSRVAFNMNPEDGDDRSSSTPNGTSKQSAQDKDKPRLTDQEKKSNHIASEQKRRAAIREGFDRLTELVPGLEGQGRSESIVLQKTVDFIHVKLQERHELIAEIESKGGHVDDSFRPS
jgi:hypothetical protein